MLQARCRAVCRALSGRSRFLLGFYRSERSAASIRAFAIAVMGEAQQVAGPPGILLQGLPAERDKE